MDLPRWSTLWLALLLTGCAAAHAQTSAPPPAEPAPEPTEAPPAEAPREATVDEAAMAFERAERALETLVAVAQQSPRREAESEDAEAADGAVRERVTPTTPRPQARPTAPPRPEARRQAPDPCARACRALASMTRSSDRLCRLTGDGDPRCENVQQRLGRARGAVRRACSSCAD